MPKIEQLKKILKVEQISKDSHVLKKYGKDWLELYKPFPSMVLFPESRQNVEDIIKWATDCNFSLVPSGGRTGLSGAAAAQDKEVVVSFDRMNKILEFNEIEQSLTVQPGVITKSIQNWAEEKSLYFPLSFASEGSSQIGGNISTNAGGVHVIRYGSLRKWVLGLEVVTGTGHTLSLGRGLIKNTAGYDLMNLFIGSEGTLGLITEITLQLTKKPEPPCVFLFSVPDLRALMNLYHLFKSKLPLSAFEMFTALAVEHVQKNSSISFPLKEKSSYYVLIETDQSSQEEALSLFESALEKEYVLDGVISESSRQAEELWSFRENISEALSPHFPYKNDVSVRISFLPDFLSEMNNTLNKEYPDFEVVWFGHVGDGNLHINILKPEKMEKEFFLKKCEKVNDILFSVIKKYKGSISAEHGVGLLKKPYLHYSCSEEELTYMKAIKKTFDPKGILNPGKIFD
ncbi:MAG: FAD-binding oxidoreductase [Bdellovibrionales bacterium]|nr:FAD-binding oxidoreductase [Bdellovibrionales bacterium]